MSFGVTIAFIAAVLGATAAILCPSIIAAQQIASGSGADVAAWVQAVGAILAIVAGFATLAIQTILQRKAADEERRAIAEAACLLAFDALETVSDRLENALTPPDETKLLSLQGNRTTEMVSAMREFDTSRLPATLLSDFIRVRTHVYAINEKITEVYDSEEKRPGRKSREKSERRKRFVSTIRARSNAIELFNHLQTSGTAYGLERKDVSTGPHLANYINELRDYVAASSTEQ
ncbi:hypothetical protein ELH93_07160 [Rhizobium leguminosarum]|uniref:hypothetical protein n=1 Tax=Rhizobium leguminosarum TaxID=384 RepID=UPI00102F6177|nr:hypothetical protein [Rhizobium leguminosarum]TAY32399.1 hypothetical protein ELH93_07160 [Rhizobium leguminosarum]